MVMVAKSGWPVTGQREVNSWVEKTISYGRPGFGFGKVSKRAREGLLGTGVLVPRARKAIKQPNRSVILEKPPVGVTDEAGES